MSNQLNLDDFIPKMDTPEKVYELFHSLGFRVLDPNLKTSPFTYNLPTKEANLIEKIFAVANYDLRFQILLFKLQSESPEQSRREAIRAIPEKILREVDFPFIIFTPDFKTYTFTLVEKVREGPGEFKRKLTKLVVDSNQPYHTDKEILRSLVLSEDIKNPVEVYKLFQSAFNVERVTKKFFTEYREVFEKLSKEITKQNKHLKFTLFSREGSVENFTKILLGRLMFLYFIQKRGWLNCFDGWGSGDKKFLYNKFQEAKKDKKNYFKDYLEPLFFDTLNNPRRDKPDQTTIFGGRIPFLNGGLFEPEYDYTDVRNHILLENSTFDDVFSVFEKYNFTVKEDEPLEKEVAIDPEMLGKVFENLLEENLRKGKGTYYTPREIVHYMCHESLINYLSSEVGIGQEEIRNFLDREQSLEKKETLSPLIKGKAKEIDEKLADIKVLDPACGSGAFLVGMLHEVINARLSLNRELGRSLSEYELKKATIQNNIYGVDIDPGASEIAKLRLWLTLVVDHNLSEIEPLPNLDYKIMVGNSLLNEFMGVKLFDLEKARRKTSQKKMLNLFEEDPQLDLLESQTKKSTVLSELQKLHKVYFREPDPLKKKQIRSQIDKIEFDLIEATVNDEVSKLEDQTKFIAEKYLMPGFGIPQKEAERIAKISSQQIQILETFNEIKKSNVKPFFLFQLNFSDVFEKKGGFDVVIANPPYINAIDMKKNFDPNIKDAFKKHYQSAKGAYDIYILFFERGFQLLRNKGHLSFITPNKYLSVSYAIGFREYIINHHQLLKIVDVSRVKVFAEVSTYPLISFFQKGQTVDYKIITVKLIHEDISDFETKSFGLLINENTYLKLLPDYIWGFLLSEHFALVKKLYEQSVSLSKVVEIRATSTASESDEYSKYISENERSGSVKLINTGTIDPYFPLWGIDKLTNKGKKFLTPYLSLNNTIISDQRKVLYRTPKIIIAKIGLQLEAFFDETGEYGSLNTNCFYEPKNGLTLKYILAFLHTSLFKFMYSQFFGSLRMGGGYYQFQAPQLRVIPIKQINKEKKEIIEQFVDKIIKLKKLGLEKDKQQVLDYEKQIDQLVYKLYGLTPEEIAVVEGGNENH